MKKLFFLALSWYPFLVNSQCIKGTWTGQHNNVWNYANNWCEGLIPTDTSVVIIPANCPNYPTISTNVKIRDINIHFGASLIIASDTLTIKRKIEVNGSLNINSGGKVINQSILYEELPIITYRSNLNKIIAEHSVGGIAFQYYGTFNSIGEPKRIQSIVIKVRDTSMIVTLDSFYRIRNFSFCYNSTKDTFYYHVTYNKDTSLTMALLSHQWTDANFARTPHRDRRFKLDSGIFVTGRRLLPVVNRTLADEDLDLLNGISNPGDDFTSWVHSKKETFFTGVAKHSKKLLDIAAVVSCGITADGIAVVGIAPLPYTAAAITCVGTTMFNREIKSFIDKSLGINVAAPISSTPSPILQLVNQYWDRFLYHYKNSYSYFFNYSAPSGYVIYLWCGSYVDVHRNGPPIAFQYSQFSGFLNCAPCTQYFYNGTYTGPPMKVESWKITYGVGVIMTVEFLDCGCQ